MQLTHSYIENYNSACNDIGFIVESMSEKPGRVVGLALQNGGLDAVQALFDATMDTGNRAALVTLLDSPALQESVRDRLETFLYGKQRKPATLFM